MAGKDDPRTGQPLDEIKLEELELSAPFMGALDQLELVTMLDIQGSTQGGNDWGTLESKLKEHADMPNDGFLLAMADLKTKYGFAVENAPESKVHAKKKPKELTAPQKYVASHGTEKYEFKTTCSVGAGGREQEQRGAKSVTSATISIGRSDGSNENATAGISLERAIELFDNTALDMRLTDDIDEEQNELEGMERDRIPPVSGIVEIKSLTVKPESINFGITLTGQIDKISLRKFRKHAATFECTVIERHGEATGKANLKADPDQQKLPNAA